MIWSALKIILFVAGVAGLTWGAGLLSEVGGGISLTIGYWELSLDTTQAVIALVVLVALIWLALKILGLIGALLRFANGDETAISRYFDRRSQAHGYEALSEGMMAIAAGDGRMALAKAAKAERHLRRPDLTNLLAAQAAELTGDTKKAEEVYKKLLRDDRTRFVGVRGLMLQKLKEGDTGTAMRLAEKAFALKPNHSETGDILLRLQAAEEDWAGARKTLAEKARQGVLPRDVQRRRDAVLALEEAKDVFRSGTSIEAREKAIEANRLSPDLVPAAVMAAQSYITDGKPKYAERVLKKAWSVRPHPDIAAAFASVYPDETATARIKRFRQLEKMHPDHPETQMLMAELHIADRDFEAAKVALGTLPETEPTARSLTLLAATERGQGAEDAVVRALLTRAVSAPRGPQWVCENCNTIHDAWAPVCENCQGFDTIAWLVHSDKNKAMPAGTDMLPLFVSANDGASDTAVEQPAETDLVDAETDSASDAGASRE